MTDNYKTIEHKLRKYSFEFLKVSPEPLNMLETLNKNNPQMIQDAQKPNLLAGAIVYIYLKRNNLNGRGGITAKSVGEYFDVKDSAITQKAFDVEFWLEGRAKHLRTDEPYEFIDKDRFEVNELYWEFIESPEADDVKKSIKALKGMVKKDADYFDPYITLHEYYLMDRDFKNALNIFMELLKSNHNDNIGARYSIVAILEGFGSQEEYEEQFESKNGMGLDGMALEEWFYKAAQKHKNVIGWWLNLED